MPNFNVEAISTVKDKIDLNVKNKMANYSPLNFKDWQKLKY